MAGAPAPTPVPIVTAEDGHWWFHSRTQALIAILDPLVRGKGRVLDVGSGAGNMVHHLARYGSVIGVDNAWAPLTVAWQRGYRSLPAEATALPFAPESFDLVALLDVIEHSPDDRGMVAEAYRVCRPGGLVVVTTPAHGWLWSHNDVINHHYRRYTASGLREILESTGFAIRRLSYTYFLVFPAAAGLILARRALGAKPDLTTPDDGAYQVEMEPTPEPFNSILTTVGSWEAQLLRRMDLPLGTALLAVAERRAGSSGVTGGDL
ncbi:MAG: class I SAM-dependent methyltransferase [Anaerolineae bacterium]|nr:class I SAM-dependent methyltransferase [Anaerolineae bacterium]